MTISMYTVSVPIFAQFLAAQSACIDKVVAHIEAKQLDPNFFLNMRLYSDMYPYMRQVQQASTHAARCTAPAARYSRIAPSCAAGWGGNVTCATVNATVNARCTANGWASCAANGRAYGTAATATNHGGTHEDQSSD